MATTTTAPADLTGQSDLSSNPLKDVESLITELSSLSAFFAFRLFLQRAQALITGLVYVSILVLPKNHSLAGGATDNNSNRNSSTNAKNNSNNRKGGMGSSTANAIGVNKTKKGAGRGNSHGSGPGSSGSNGGGNFFDKEKSLVPLGTTADGSDLEAWQRVNNALEHQSSCGLDWNTCCVYELQNSKATYYHAAARDENNNTQNDSAAGDKCDDGVSTTGGDGVLLLAPEPEYPLPATAAFHAAIKKNLEGIICNEYNNDNNDDNGGSGTLQGPHYADWERIASLYNAKSLACLPMYISTTDTTASCTPAVGNSSSTASTSDGSTTSSNNNQVLVGVLTLASTDPHAFESSRLVWLLAMALAPVAAQLTYADPAASFDNFVRRMMPVLLFENFLRKNKERKKENTPNEKGGGDDGASTSSSDDDEDTFKNTATARQKQRQQPPDSVASKRNGNSGESKSKNTTTNTDSDDEGNGAEHSSSDQYQAALTACEQLPEFNLSLSAMSKMIGHRLGSSSTGLMKGRNDEYDDAESFEFLFNLVSVIVLLWTSSYAYRVAEYTTALNDNTSGGISGSSGDFNNGKSIISSTLAFVIKTFAAADIVFLSFLWIWVTVVTCEHKTRPVHPPSSSSSSSAPGASQKNSGTGKKSKQPAVLITTMMLKLVYIFHSLLFLPIVHTWIAWFILNTVFGASLYPKFKVLSGFILIFLWQAKQIVQPIVQSSSPSSSSRFLVSLFSMSSDSFKYWKKLIGKIFQKIYQEGSLHFSSVFVASLSAEHVCTARLGFDVTSWKCLGVISGVQFSLRQLVPLVMSFMPLVLLWKSGDLKRK